MVILGYRDFEGLGCGMCDDVDGLCVECDVEMVGVLFWYGEDLVLGGVVEVVVGGDEIELVGLFVECVFDVLFFVWM